MRKVKDFVTLTHFLETDLVLENKEGPVIYQTKYLLAQETPALVVETGERTDCSGYSGCCACAHENCRIH